MQIQSKETKSVFVIMYSIAVEYADESAFTHL